MEEAVRKFLSEGGKVTQYEFIQPKNNNSAFPEERILYDDNYLGGLSDE